MANYVDNKKLYKILSEYQERKEKAEEEGKPLPRIPEYVGYAILKIAENMATKPNFSGYPFKEDMIGFAIENCVHYIDNFNRHKYNNPFGYISTIVRYAFLRKIFNEKKELVAKYKLTDKMNLELSVAKSGDVFSEVAETLKLPESAHAFIKNFEEKQKK